MMGLIISIYKKKKFNTFCNLMWYWVVQEFIVREMPQCFYNNTGILRNNSYDFMSICFANILCFNHHLSKTENKTFYMQICLREFMCLWSFFSSIESKSCAHSLGLLFKSFDTLKNLLETTELLFFKKKENKWMTWQCKFSYHSSIKAACLLSSTVTLQDHLSFTSVLITKSISTTRLQVNI